METVNTIRWTLSGHQAQYIEFTILSNKS